MLKITQKANNVRSPINYDEIKLNLRDYYPHSNNIYVLGDIHGDLMATITALKKANLISIDCNPLKTSNSRLVDKINWNGGSQILVQMGDQIDRTRPENWDDNNVTISNTYHDEGSDLKILELFDKLALQAHDAGGHVISILGNHELMNVDGDFRYVSLKEFREFGNRFFIPANISNNKLPFGYNERLKVFSPGGIIAKRFAHNRKAVVQIGQWVFVHGGFVPYSAKKFPINQINLTLKNYLLGTTNQKIIKNYQILFNNENDEISPFWSRQFGYSETDDQKIFDKTIQLLNSTNNPPERIEGMIIGHSPQFYENKAINSSFNGKLWRTDVGMSKAFGPRNNKGNNVHRNIQLLMITPKNEISII